MQLREAIAKAVKWVWKGKQRSPTKSVRFLPSNNGGRGALYATNGPQGILLFLDQGEWIPDAMLDAEKLSAAITNVKEVRLTADGAMVSVAGVAIESGNVHEYPPIPQLPPGDFQPMPDWPTVEKLLHAVSKDPQQPVLRCLHFRHDLVEATDRFRVARACVRTPWEGLVPAEAFRHLPQGEMSALFDEDMAVFRVGEELRFSTLKKGTFQDCDKLLPVGLPAGWSTVRVETADLVRVAKRAKALAPACGLLLTNTEASLRVDGFQEQLPAVVSPSSTTPVAVSLHVNAEWLVDAVSRVSTPVTRLGFASPGDPLRIESGAYCVGLWPFMGG